MRRALIVAACLGVLTLGASGCTSVTPRSVDRNVTVLDSGIQLALRNALRAETDWERNLWLVEYERRSHVLESYLDAVRTERSARADHWRQLSQTAQQAGFELLQQAIWRDGS